MYISKIRIQNYRNFTDFTMEFNKGLNVIIGANNSGKTGLLNAINFLSSSSSSISVDDFNKDNLLQYSKLYTDSAPSITVEYSIFHEISENNTTDESIIKLLPFLDIKDFSESRHEKCGDVKYNITARVKAIYSLKSKRLEYYKTAIKDVNGDFTSYLRILKGFLSEDYEWSYSNGSNDNKVDKKDVKNIFDIRYIGAERTSAEVDKEAKQEIIDFSKSADVKANFEKYKEKVSDEIKKLLDSSFDRLTKLFVNEKNQIGLKKGYVAIEPSVQVDFSLPDTYVTEVKDTKGGYILPLKNNGLGYNNLINIFILIKLAEIRQKNDFRILCLEEPEAHLHPAMQYKLFKYLRELDNKSDLNQQIFITTHSSNISAVAGLDNMFMMAYNRDGNESKCTQQSLQKQFSDIDGTTNKADAKAHLTKFLDVTRSDMLFADKVILVEGIAEKLLLPMFMEKCGCPYEDEHVSIVEIGGKHFKYFIELFNGNAVKKKVLCITDKDFKWIKESEGNSKLLRYDDYKSYEPKHITDIKGNFPIDNLEIVSQSNGGSTFEDELFLANMKDENVAKALFKKAVVKEVSDLVDSCGFNLTQWKESIETKNLKSNKTITKFLDAFDSRMDTLQEHFSSYEKLIFAEIFLYYASNKKGDVALEILTDGTLVSELNVPTYIKDGLKWLLK